MSLGGNPSSKSFWDAVKRLDRCKGAFFALGGYNHVDTFTICLYLRFFIGVVTSLYCIMKSVPLAGPKEDRKDHLIACVFPKK